MPTGAELARLRDTGRRTDIDLDVAAPMPKAPVKATQTLAQAVRAKHPGAYDDLSDQQLEASVRKKFPGAYDDIQSTTAPTPTEPRQRGVVDRIGDTLEGVAKNVEDFAIGGVYRTGVGGTLYNAAQLASKVLPESLELRDRPEWFEPRNTAERAGKLVENTAEFMAPGGLVKAGATKIAAKAPKIATAGRAALEAASAGGVATLQGGNPLVAAATAGVGSGVASKIGQAAPALRDKAEKLVVQALGPTKERFKAMATRLAPEMLKRSIRGSREGMLTRASEAAEVAGQQVDDALQQYGQQQVGTAPIVSALETAKDAFRTVGQAGKVVEYEPRAIKQLDGLQKIVSDLGPDATVEQLVAVRRAWDRVVDQAGGFAQRAGGAVGMPLKDTTEAWAKREATGAIRKVLADDVPELAAVNREFAFWKGLDDVLTQTVQRTQAQGPGLGRQVATVAGAAAGSANGIGTAVLTGKLAQMAHTLFTSPRWRMVDASARNALADAIESGKPGRVLGKLVQINASIGARLPQPAGAR